MRHRFACTWLLWALLPVLLGLGPSASPVHPLDGPDIELALRVGAREGRLLLRANGVAVEGLVGLPGSSPQGLDPAWAEGLAERMVARLLDNGEPWLRLHFEGGDAVPQLERARIEPSGPNQAALFPRFGAKAGSVLELELSLKRPAQASWVEVEWLRYSMGPDPQEFGPLEFVPLVAQAGAKRKRTELAPEAPSLHWIVPVDTAPILEDVASPPPAGSTSRARSLRLAGLGAIGLIYLAWLTLHGRRGAALLAAAATLALGAAAARGLSSPLGADQACSIFAALQRNLYASFASVDRDQVYDSLAQCVDGALLEDIFTQVQRSLEITDHGGARGRVEDLTLVDCSCLERGITGAGSAWFRIQATWRVRAIVEHSGHSHERLEEYTGRFDVLSRTDGWRITSQELERQERLEVPDEGPPPEPSEGTSLR